MTSLQRISAATLLVVFCALLPSHFSAKAFQPPALPADDHRVATAWFTVLEDLIRQSPGYSPPVAARTIGYVGVTLYEAIYPAIPGGQSLVGRLNELTWTPPPDLDAPYHWPLVANSALASIQRRLFAHAGESVRRSIDLLEESIRTRYEHDVAPETLRWSIRRGRDVAAAIFEWSKHDGGHEGYFYNYPRTYRPPTGEGLWAPTPPAYYRALQPTWGANRRFVLPDAEACTLPPPPAYSTDPASPIYAEAWEVYTTVKNLSTAQRETALYWADDPVLTATPPGHSLAIATQLLRQENATLARAADVYLQLSVAIADSFIVCWRDKYVYNLLRPITYIRNVIDPTWNAMSITDPLITPPFPEYPSGHSTEAGAMATVLTALFGDNYRFTDHSAERLGFAPRTYDSFWAAAEEAALSRLYGGIHFRSANENGLMQGQCVGETVLARLGTGSTD